MGCHESSEAKAEKANEAARNAARKAERAAHDVERSSAAEAARSLEESRRATDEAVRARDDLAEAIDRERTALGSVLSREIEWVDDRISSMARDALAADASAVRDEKERDLAAVRAWRERLARDLDDVTSPPANAEWSALKQRVESDLYADRPVGLPHAWEKPYGI